MAFLAENHENGTIVRLPDNILLIVQAYYRPMMHVHRFDVSVSIRFKPGGSTLTLEGGTGMCRP